MLLALLAGYERTTGTQSANIQRPCTGNSFSSSTPCPGLRTSRSLARNAAFAWIAAAFLCPMAAPFAQGQTRLPAPDCEDSPEINTALLPDESLPVHAKLATFLASNQSQAKLTCQSARFSYEGWREGKSITINSQYRNSRVRHAELMLTDDRNIGGFRKHGVVRVAWPDGKPQALEYFCFGFAVGYHQYYDKKGVLKSVADHTKSDYQFERHKKGGHTFRRGNSTMAYANMGGSAVRFRETFSVDGANLKRERLQSAGVLGSGWTERDPASTVEQWTQPGDQGTVAYPDPKRPSERWELTNAPLDYVPFAETYQRHKQKLPGITLPSRFNTDVLECPWIDEAMSLAYTDKRFALAPAKPITDAEHQASPAVQYASCIAKPNVDCLLAFAVDRAKEPGTQEVVFLRGTAVAAIAAGRPRYAIEAMNESLGRTRGFPVPNPWFAAAAALKGQAEHAAGNRQAADKSLDDAFAHAMTRQRGYEGRNAGAIMLSAPVLASLGRLDQVRKAYEMALEEKAPRAHEILLELGLGHARAGQFELAFAVVEELRRTRAPMAANPDGRAGGEKLAEAIRALSGNPLAAYSRQQAYYLALAGTAQGLAERGDLKESVAALAEIEQGLKSSGAQSSAWDTIRAEAAESYARLGDVRRAEELLSAIKYDPVRAWSTAAGALCAARKAKEARAFLDRAATLVSSTASLNFAHLALGYSRCNLKDLARDTFRRAKDAADKTPYCDGDHCANFTGMAQHAVSDKIIESNEIDLLDGWPAQSGLALAHQIRAAVRLAQLGKPDAAMRRLASIAEGASAAGPLGDLALARAEVFTLLGSRARAKVELGQAYRAAKALEFSNARAAALSRLAAMQTRAGLCDAAGATLREARIDVDRTRMSGIPQVHHDAAGALAAVLARGFARCGLADEAYKTASSLLLDAGTSSGRDHVAGLLALDVLAEVAVARAVRQDITGALKELAAIPPMPSRLTAAVAIERLESKHGSSSRARPAKAFLAAQAGGAGEYFLHAQSDRERRVLIGHFAGLIRSMDKSTKESPIAFDLFTMLVSEKSRIGSLNWRARASCELGYTGLATWHQDAERLFEEGIATAKSHQARTFPLDPPPSGACAYWLRLAGDDPRAQRVADQHIEGWRAAAANVGFAHRAGTGALLGLAISYAEAEGGEFMVDWSRRVWDQ